MTLLKKQFLGICLLLTSLLFAQETAIYTSQFKDYQKALTLYNNKQYKVAQSLFDDIKYETNDEVLKSDCSYYIANCAVRLNQKNADDLIEDFVEEYPTSTKKNTAFLDVAEYYFENSDYAYARKWYGKVDDMSIARAELDKFNFNYGYSLYKTRNKNGAEKYLNRVKDNSEYASQAKYYLGFMAYEGDDYNSANEYFDAVSDNQKYKEKLNYYQADLNFKLGKFEKAIKLAEAQLPKSNAEETSELSKIIGESYFNLEKYAEALPYLKAYKGKDGKLNNTDFYQLGYTYYKQNDFENAISEFNKIIDGNNSVAQNAYYHLGESYINLDKKPEALNAFRNASQMSFDNKIKEDAWLNYAKLSYEIGNPYQSVPQVLSSYLETYPKTPYKEEIEDLLIDSYITSKNYKEALLLLEDKNSFENKLAYQKVAFYRGIELYNEDQYAEALEMFNNSLKQPRDEEFVARATFWKAETDYNLTNYNDALIGFKQFKQDAASDLSEAKNLDYNLAYTYFKLKDYKQSFTYFQNFISKNSDDKLRANDAYLRLGDGYFVSSDYANAISAYEKAIDINEIESDYAAFQKAMSHGYMGKSSKKNEGLEKFIRGFLKSGLRDDAIYELANSYIKANDISRAMRLYEQLNKEYPQSAFISKSLLRQGLVHYNADQNEAALSKFKKVANDFAGSQEAVQAVSTARLIYIDLGRVDEYARWIKTLDYLEVTDAELDNTTYLAAEKQYLDSNTDEAIKQFNKYLNAFPSGIHAVKSHFYLAQLYYKKELFGNAKPNYEAVVNAAKNEYTEQAMVKLCEIYLNDSDWDNAKSVLLRLENEADYPQNIIYAESNLMNAYYQTEDFNEAETYAEKVLANLNLDNKIKNDVQLIIARSAWKTGNEEKAKSAYTIVEKSASGSVAAEALYYNAYFKNKEGIYEASNIVIQKLAKDYSSYKLYSAKGLVVMAKNYDALGDAFQATYILESVISSFPEFEDVVAEAKSELERVKSEEAKTNSSIKSGDN
ncbi:MAG: tetratricopeptide repeat protein [Winogradskyella sp.]|uniref:tetratricopeptide repeat protein n=1 Tax=Winogradskyella sp. TaxID=1883156 RepID=UPI0017E5A4D5|nr:tetratricopeptide repeat protein [Winogradskyella sp.]MBT8243739.1 tetratricopeptide repeat protein [Winogradskyella sp.]NNK22067.1 tetratricopeptide repeat protein [Winogradskyella sp.]